MRLRDPRETGKERGRRLAHIHNWLQQKHMTGLSESNAVRPMREEKQKHPYRGVAFLDNCKMSKPIEKLAALSLESKKCEMAKVLHNT